MNQFKWSEQAQQIVQQYDTFLRAQGDGVVGPALNPLPKGLQHMLAFVLARCVQATDTESSGTTIAVEDLLPAEVARLNPYWVSQTARLMEQFEEICGEA